MICHKQINTNASVLTNHCLVQKDVKFPPKTCKLSSSKFYSRVEIGSEVNLEKPQNSLSPREGMSHLLRIQTRIMCHYGET